MTHKTHKKKAHSKSRDSETIPRKKTDDNTKEPDDHGRIGSSFSEEDPQEKKSIDATGGEPIIEGSYHHHHHQLISFPQWETPCSSFFQQRGAIDFKSYLRLKKEEKVAIIQYEAAKKIQALFRGFLTRCNMKIVLGAAIKIQAFIRGTLARKIYAAKLKELAEIRHLMMMEQAATKIQAAWRGYLSRKNKLNFKQYKKIQRKNEALKKSIDKINDLEDALLSQSGSVGLTPASSSGKTSITDDLDRGSSGGSRVSMKSSKGSIVENLIRESFQELASNMSDSRVAELYAYASYGGVEKSDEKSQKKNLKAKVRAESIDDLFPEFPHIEGLIRPDDAKVNALKAAIRMLHKQMQSRDLKKLEKVHYLLRTTAVPGVYSDIYCNELTEIEKELKSVKFWKPPPDPRKKPKMGKSKRFVEYSDSEEEEMLYQRDPSSPVNTAVEYPDEYEGEGAFFPPFPMVNNNNVHNN